MCFFRLWARTNVGSSWILYSMQRERRAVVLRVVSLAQQQPAFPDFVCLLSPVQVSMRAKNTC